MCDPTGGVATAAIIGLATTAYSVDQSKKQARRQERATARAQAVQEEEILSQKGVQMQQRSAAARAERARLRAMSAETGLAGLSFTELLDNVSFQEGTDLANLAANNTSQVNASRAERDSRIAGIQRPDYSGLINAGLNMYSVGYDQQWWGQGNKNPGGK
jgi:hypothetical protein